MNQKQRLKYSLLLSVVVLAIMFGLTGLEKSGHLTEETFKYIAIAVAIVVVVINGYMRRKVRS
ncbi:hypothetical protein [Pseudomonas sp. dw_358]|uniref:hypothetical protein n=1 Tax=Pseudomonas sp. dw_358 TaxID=2720083 RepID=UPI001BD4FD6E|nr:hypothetical protein [Pseudomonas sp. dw_358]